MDKAKKGSANGKLTSLKSVISLHVWPVGARFSEPAFQLMCANHNIEHISLPTAYEHGTKTMQAPLFKFCQIG